MSEDTPPESASPCGVSAGPHSPARLRRARISGGKPLDLPAGAARGIEEAVVQPIGAPLPELKAPRQDAVAAPVRRTRRRVAMASPRFLHRILKHLAGGDAGALRRSPRGEARSERPGGEIRIGLGRAHLLHLALDAHL